MQDEIYKLAFATLRRHVAEAGVDAEVEEGEIVVEGHRLGLSVACDGVVRQQDHVIVPLDIQIHLDGDEGDKFRMGTLGIGPDRDAAARAAVSEWHVLAADPVLAALGAPLVARRKAPPTVKWGDWAVFPGRAGVRGPLPPSLQGGGPLLGEMLAALRSVVIGWPQPTRWELKSIYVMTTIGSEGAEAQAAVNGFVDEPLAAKLATLPWPRPGETSLYKQLFVLRGGAER
jgi:hypothetical protein